MELNRKVTDAWKSAMDKGKDKVVLLCDSRVRAPLARLLSRSVPMLPIIAYDEIVLGTSIEPIDTLSRRLGRGPDGFRARRDGPCPGLT